MTIAQDDVAVATVARRNTTPYVSGNTSTALGAVLLAVAEFVGVLAATLLCSDPTRRALITGGCVVLIALCVWVATIEWPRVEYR